MRGVYYDQVRTVVCRLDGLRAIGGPLQYLKSPAVNTCLYADVYAFNVEVERSPERVDVVLSVSTDFDHDKFPAPPPGYVIRRQEQAGSDMPLMGADAELVFSWVPWGEIYVPPHWLEAGVERCLALYRIFGADETAWPAMERAA